MTRIGIDIGSTTIKIAAINAENHLVFSTYKRHHAKSKLRQSMPKTIWFSPPIKGTMPKRGRLSWSACMNYWQF